MRNPDYFMTYVAPYSQIRYMADGNGFCAVKVGGHYRRKQEFKALVPAMSCVCKFERLASPRGMAPPTKAHKQRWTEWGHIVPLRERYFVFS